VDESAGVKPPDSENTWMVKSYSSERLHYVKISDFVVLFVMTSACLIYKSMKICEHSLVIAMVKVYKKFS